MGFVSDGSGGQPFLISREMCEAFARKVSRGRRVSVEELGY